MTRNQKIALIRLYRTIVSPPDPKDLRDDWRRDPHECLAEARERAADDRRRTGASRETRWAIMDDRWFPDAGADDRAWLGGGKPDDGR